jgi:hypothetical protein
LVECFWSFSLGVALGAAPEYKNLQILKGIPPARIPMVMSTFNRVLGVECTHCHVADAMEKEDKPQFGTTRKMFQMRNTVAQQYQVNVSCWTCHHGNSKPAPPALEIKDVWPEELKLTPGAGKATDAAGVQEHQVLQRHGGFDAGGNELS